MVILVALILGGCSPESGLPTDPSGASTCAELADVAISQLESFIDDAAAARSYEDFIEAFEADGGEAFNAATAVYSEGSVALDARRAEVGCPDEEFRGLLCARLEQIEAAGSAADQLLEPSRAACS
jgi:hypothetical protein